MTKNLYIVRGLPGSGKTKLAEDLANDIMVMVDIPSAVVHSADHFFEKKDGSYTWNPKQAWIAHKTCKKKVDKSMENGIPHIFVTNAFTTEGEISGYIKEAPTYGYNVIRIIVEDNHSTGNVHNVPEEKVEEMEKKFSVKLRPKVKGIKILKKAATK